jgi:hypothetical protein
MKPIIYRPVIKTTIYGRRRVSLSAPCRTMVHEIENRRELLRS